MARLAAGVALSSALVLPTSGVAVADTERGHSGLVGRHSLTDRASAAGARCAYSWSDTRNGGAARITVRGPNVFARSRTRAIDSQVVGWRVILQQTEDYLTWYTVWYSPTYKATATDAARAPFGARSFRVPFNAFVRARVQMFWYVPGSTTAIQGRAIHEVDFYDRYLDRAFEDQVDDACPPDLTDPIP